MLQILRGDENLLQKGYTCTFGDKIPEDNIRDETDTCRKQKSVSNVHVHLELGDKWWHKPFKLPFRILDIGQFVYGQAEMYKSVLKEL